MGQINILFNRQIRTLLLSLDLGGSGPRLSSGSRETVINFISFTFRSSCAGLVTMTGLVGGVRKKRTDWSGPALNTHYPCFVRMLPEKISFSSSSLNLIMFSHSKFLMCKEGRLMGVQFSCVCVLARKAEASYWR